MHLVKSYERLKFFKIQDFFHFLRFCLNFIIESRNFLDIGWIFAGFCRTLQGSLLYEVPGGNLVDGLPPVASNTGEGRIGSAPKNN